MGVVVGIGFVVVECRSLVCGVVWVGVGWGGVVVVGWCCRVRVGWRYRVGVGLGLVCARHCLVGVGWVVAVC